MPKTRHRPPLFAAPGPAPAVASVKQEGHQRAAAERGAALPNRHERCASARSARHGDDVLDRATLIQITASLIETDPTISGATLIMPDGEVTFVDAQLLRGGGNT